jgi:UDP-N-acetylglucosamine--N-acetylmuramyl-(pentapeptide) pyrophosphoryl-undecaprenol N-acetylglucosamine transferase
MNKTIILAAGGTGGHVFPAIALGTELKNRGYNPILLTDHRIQKFAAALNAVPHHIIHAGPLSPRGIFGLVAGLIETFLFFRKVKPIAVVGFGGYPSFPGVAMGLLQRLPTVLHEQNSYMGKVNRIFARYVKQIAISFPNTKAVPADSKRKCILVGNPIRPSIKKLRNSIYSIHDDEIYLLITGGSQGTSIFSEIVPQALSKLPIYMQRKLRVTQQCRADDVSTVQDFYMRNNIKAKVSAFIDDMSLELARADMVIGRSGASTCAELAVAGRPSILVPYPYATEDHQTTNAEWLKEAGAAIIIPQTEFTVVILTNLLQTLFQSPEKRASMAEATKSVSMPDAEAALADVVIKLLG